MSDQLAGRPPAEPEPIESVAAIDSDYPTTPVPRTVRRSAFTLVVVLLGFTVFTPTMAAGAGLGPAFDFGSLIGVIALGSIILGTYVAFMGYVGARTGLTTVMMARRSFGTRGSKVASIILGGTQVGWYGVTVGLVGELTAQATGWDSLWARAAIMLAASALMCVTALYGYHGMFWASLVATPLVLILAVWVAVSSISSVGGVAALSQIEPTTTMTLATAVTVVVGTFVSAGTQVPNWTRFARSGSAAVTASLIAFVIGNGAMVTFGAIGALTVGEGDFVVVLFQLGLVGAGLFLLFGNLWTTNADTAYAFGVAGAELFDKPRKAPFVIGGAVIGTALALIGVHNHLIAYLGLVGTFIPPLGGVIIADWFLRWRAGEPAGYRPPALEWRNLLAFVVGTAVAYVTGLLEFGIPPLFGVLVAAALVISLNYGRRVVR